MQALVAAGGDVHGGDRAGECPLHVAVRCDSLETVEWLLFKGMLNLWEYVECVTHSKGVVNLKVC